MVLEYYECGTLYDIIAKEKVLDEKEISLIMRQVLEGLEYLHSKHIVHRDIKPANIMVRRLSSIKEPIRIFIGDFGIAEQLSVSTHSFKKIGTPTYMAPEVFTGEGHSLKADIFSAGSIMFNLCCFQQIYYPQNNKEVLNLTKSFNIPKLNALIGEIKLLYSGECVNFIQKLLEPSQQARPTASMCLSDKFIQMYMQKNKTVSVITTNEKSIKESPIPNQDFQNLIVRPGQNKQDKKVVCNTFKQIREFYKVKARLQGELQINEESKHEEEKIAHQAQNRVVSPIEAILEEKESSHYQSPHQDDVVDINEREARQKETDVFLKKRRGVSLAGLNVPQRKRTLISVYIN